MTQRPLTAWPVAADGRPVLLYGGVFDPPHRAHVELATAARDAAAAGGWLVFVPAARSPFKGAPVSEDRHRVAMLRLAIADVPRAVVWTDELERAGPGEASYWVDTVRRAREAAPGAELRFLIGADQAEQFHRWRDFREILRVARPAVMLRAPLDSREALLEALRGPGVWSERELRDWGAAVVRLPLRKTSATEIRSRLRSGVPAPDELDPAVLEYIRRQGLYATKA